MSTQAVVPRPARRASAGAARGYGVPASACRGFGAQPHLESDTFEALLELLPRQPQQHRSHVQPLQVISQRADGRFGQGTALEAGRYRYLDAVSTVYVECKISIKR